MTNLVVYRGLPGSGKSTVARELEGYLHYEPDYYVCDTHGTYRFYGCLWPLAVQMCLRMTDYALAAGENVVVSDVFPTWDDLEPFVRLARHHGATVDVVTCDGQWANMHGVPLTKLDDMLQAFIPHKDIITRLDHYMV